VGLQKTVTSLDFVRVVVSDPHGLPRSKSFTSSAFLGALRDGARFSSAPLTLDTGANDTLETPADGPSIGVPEIRGTGNFVAVPDPLTFRVLPYTSQRCGWVIADEHLRSGAEHPLSSRRVLRHLCHEVAARGWRYVIGLELEWYLTRYVHRDDIGEAGGVGIQGVPPAVTLVDSGYQINLEGLTDALEPVLGPLADALLRLGLPLRTVEHEFGPGQIEFTFEPMDALEAADAALLVRAVTKQVCARLGYHASFMALPGIRGLTPSAWHLHQSLALRSSGANLFSPALGADGPLSDVGRGFLGGLLQHAAASTLLAVPTVNGFRRFSGQSSVTPNRVSWSTEHRGALMRVVGGADDQDVHIECRMGEPCANPYLYIASQVSAGLDGVDRQLDPGEAAADPHSLAITALPDSLGAALTAFAGSEHCRKLLGRPLASCLVQLKSSEVARHEAWRAGEDDKAGVSEWEHREYFHRY
jgi:glutamine synthetase